jgi:hypothetical protein
MKHLFILPVLLLLPFIGYNQTITKYNPQKLYEQPGGMFAIDSLRTLSINFYNPDYDEILVANWFANNGERLPAKVEFSNGEALDNVAIRYKGNSTFYMTNSYGIPKLPLNLDMNDLVSGQKLMGHKKLKLASSMFDPTFAKEITGYQIYQRYLPSPEANFMRVEVQGKYLGLYINTESVDKHFLEKHFNEKNGVLFKCDPIQRYRQPGPSGNSDLNWLGADSTSYYNHYSLKSDYGWKELIHMIDVLNNNPNQIDSVLNVDRILWAFAVNQAIANFDTYNGVDQRNYYLYQTKDGLFQMIPWDVSESFISAMLSDVDNPNDWYNYDPYNGSKCWWHPLTSILTGDPNSKYGKIYSAHLRTILEESLDTIEILNFINRVQSIAEDAAKTDPNNIWNMDLYRSNVHSDFSAYGNSFAGIITTVNKRKSFLNQFPEIRKEAPVISDVDVHDVDHSWFVTTSVHNAGSVELMVSFNDFNSKFKSFEMNDNGLNGDVLAGDGVFTAPVPQQTNGTTKFYIRASNNEAIQLSPKRAEYEFYIFSPPTKTEMPNIKREISLYPNPTQDLVYIKGGISQSTQFEIISSMGELVATGVLDTNEKRIDLTRFSPGVYFVKIGNNTFKISKTK